MFSNKLNKELALRQAAARGELDTCKNLIEKQGASVNSAGSESQRTSLHQAAYNNHVDVVRYLVKKGAVSTYDKDGRTPYDLTTTPEIKRVLHYDGQGPTSTVNVEFNHAEYTAFGYRFIDQDMNNEMSMFDSLSQFKSFMKKNNLTPNSYVSGIPLITMLSFNFKCYGEMLQYLLKNGANPNNKAHRIEYDAYENTPLHAILSSELIARAKLFITYVSDPKISRIPIDCTVQDVEGKTTLIMGALLRNTQIVNLCLSRFGTAAIDFQDNKGRTALHYAYLFGNSKMIKVLKHYGADEALMDKEGKTPKDMLHLHPAEIKRVLLSFHIDPDRDKDFRFETCISTDGRHIGSENRVTNNTIYKACISDRIALINDNPETDNTIIMQAL